jgi:hypothetical protein
LIATENKRMLGMDLEKTHLTPDEFRSETGFSMATVRRLLADGLIRKIQFRPRGRILIPASELTARADQDFKNDFVDHRKDESSSSSDTTTTERLPGPPAKWRKK